MKRLLVLEDGSFYEGIAIGSSHYRVGELVFNTTVTGYQEVFTDAASAGHITVMTYPLIGNCGINRDDYESITPAIFGIVIKEECDQPSNWRFQETLEAFLKREDIPGIANIDTRLLVRKLRQEGSLKATFADEGEDIAEVVQRIKDTPVEDMTAKVSSDKPFSIPGDGKRVVIMDFGIRLSTLRALAHKGFDLIVLPYNASFETVMSFVPDGIFLSSGPGDPHLLKAAIATIKAVLPHTAIFGVGLGCDLLALALDAKVQKLKVAHHGNHPVRNLKDGKIMITNQNHDYQIIKDSLNKDELEVTHIELNDHSVEGIAHQTYPAFGVAFYPPTHDAENDLLEQFAQMMEKE